MRFLFLTHGSYEAEFYGRASAELVRLGHETAQITWSVRSARALRRRGLPAFVLPEELERAGAGNLEREALRLESTYPMRSLRDVWRTDWPLARKPEAECLERTVRHYRALERLFDEIRPDVVIPEVGSETFRTAAHHIAIQRGIDTLFLFYTIFPRPLRLYANTMHAPIVEPAEVRPLEDHELAEVERFIVDFTAADAPIRAYRKPRVTLRTLRDFALQVGGQLTTDRRNEYVRPRRYAENFVREKARGTLASRLYEPLAVGDRPFVYFPLHVTDDYKIKRIIPHCVDQAAIIELIAASLPQGVDLVLKEHPMSIGRNPLGLLRRLTSHENVRLVDPYTSSHELIRRARAVAVISSTVGLEALLHGRPVMTVGQPFYAGYGITVDVDSFREIPDATMELLRFFPDRELTLRFLHAAMRRCLPGKPAAVDGSEQNARALAASLHTAVQRAPADGATLPSTPR
jgi:hypothetical protein